MIEVFCAARKRAWRDPGFRIRMIGALNSPKARARRSKTAKRNWSDPDYRARMTEVNHATANTTEHRARMSAISKQYWRENYGLMVAATRSRSPESARKQGETLSRTLEAQHIAYEELKLILGDEFEEVMTREAGKHPSTRLAYA